MVYHININHNAITSTSEPINLQIRVNLPMYIKFTQFENANEDDRYPVPSYSITNGAVSLSVSTNVYFTIIYASFYLYLFIHYF